MSDTALPLRRERFCHELLKDFNLTRAAVRAGFAKAGAGVEGARLLKNANVQARITELLRPILEQEGLTRQEVIRSLRSIITADFSKAYDAQGRLLAPADIPEELRLAVAGVETCEEYSGSGSDREKTGETKKLKFHPKVPALDLAAKILRLIDDGGGPRVFAPVQYNEIVINTPTDLTQLRALTADGSVNGHGH